MQRPLPSMLLPLVGKDLMEQTHYVRQRAAAKRGKILDYVAVSDKLNALFDKRIVKADETRKVNEQIKALQEQLAQANKTAT